MPVEVDLDIVVYEWRLRDKLGKEGSMRFVKRLWYQIPPM
jgi:hypothetical protein